MGRGAIYGHDLQGWHKPTEDMRRVELKYYCIFVRGVLMIPMILGAMVFLLSPVYALGQGKGMLKAPAVHYLYMGR